MSSESFEKHPPLLEQAKLDQTESKQPEPEKTRLGQAKKYLIDFSWGVAKVASGTALGITMIGSSIVAGGAVGLAISFRNLPDVRILRSYVPSETNYIYDVKGRELTSIHGEANREIIPLEKISPNLKRAVIAIEDSDFYDHHGINLPSVGRAVIANYKSGGVSEGASTITMQLVKNLFLTTERTLTRKLAEAVLAIRIEQVFTKDEILEIYLNNIYWGHNNYGVQTAAESYFNKSATDLNLAESTVMAGLIQAPEKYSPFIHYEATKSRQSTVVNRMSTLGWISSEEGKKTKTEPLLVGKPTAWKASILPSITEAVAAELEVIFGKERVLKGGLRVQTTVDMNFQRMAEKSVADSHRMLRRWGLRVDQVALAAVDPRTHFVKALVGGVNYKESQFNRAIQSRRQPGSSFKPFAYYAALVSGKYTPSTVVDDAPVKYRVPKGWYRPQNYGGKKDLLGEMSFKDSLIQSRNIPIVKVSKEIGLDEIIKVCRTLGIKSPLQPVLSLPLGSIGVSPLEMAGAFATFASNGWHSKPTLILQVTDSRGNILLDNQPKPKKVLDPWATATLTTMMKEVITNKKGTGKDANIGRPAAGKTGTTSSERDVWFVGYVPQLATAVWVGNDNYQSLGKGISGGKHAAPVWRNFMLRALKDEPVKYFPAASSFPRP